MLENYLFIMYNDKKYWCTWVSINLPIDVM